MKVKFPKTFDKFLEKWYDKDNLTDEEYEEYIAFLDWFERKSEWLFILSDEPDSGFYEDSYNEKEGILSLEYSCEYPAYNLPHTRRLPIYAFIMGTEKYYDKMKFDSYARQDTEFWDIDDIVIDYIKAADLEVSTKRIVGEEYEAYLKEYLK